MAMTAFQQRVYEACSQVPAGRVTTYKLLADYLGCGSAQAVGQALKRNPFAPRVPCHRVIASNLKIGGYAGEAKGPAVAQKRALLAAEGVQFSGGRLTAAERVFDFDEV
jgi:methylated-DNA-[protein]-cysteine S-methyltransferase